VHFDTSSLFFFFHYPATTAIFTLSLHDALPISQYSDSWPISPLYYENNVQDVGKCDFEDAQTLKHPDLVRREADYVRKITQEVRSEEHTSELQSRGHLVCRLLLEKKKKKKKTKT